MPLAVPGTIAPARRPSPTGLHRSDGLFETSNDRLPGPAVVVARRGHPGPVGDLGAAFHLGGHFVEGEDLRGALCLVRRERARSLGCEALARQAVAYTGRDLVLHGDA